MTTANEYMYKISSRYLQKWLSYDIKHVKNSHFSRHFGLYRDFPNFIFERFWRFKKCVRVMFRVLCEKLT